MNVDVVVNYRAGKIRQNLIIQHEHDMNKWAWAIKFNTIIKWVRNDDISNDISNDIRNDDISDDSREILNLEKSREVKVKRFLSSKLKY
ncbi:hypothetical protein CUMW_097680 [Citrus unshiu]|uniref:Uncharacterized protein n=1 Tax=Citrus unshiu TaxID=55188 RepID=A0A2H5P2C4_CITUN|nr:hypothetical protein CUMW_097680 [Citrus unshiu]